MSKAISKKALNESGMSLGGITKRSEKENHREDDKQFKWDAYGLEGI
jgi:hypothetical protein